jgi:hypothetical protein
LGFESLSRSLKKPLFVRRQDAQHDHGATFAVGFATYGHLMCRGLDEAMSPPTPALPG